MKHLTEDEFDDQFTPVRESDPHGEGAVVRNSDEGLDRDSTKLWTIVDPGEGRLLAISGWHDVNVFGYLVTEEDWTEPTEAVWHVLTDSGDLDE